MTPTQLIAWRTHNNLSQQALATRLNLSVRTLARYEKGERSIPAELGSQLASMANVEKVEEDPIITYNTHKHLYEQPYSAKRGAIRLPTHPGFGKGISYKARASELDTYVPPTPEEIEAQRFASTQTFGARLQAMIEEEED